MTKPHWGRIALLLAATSALSLLSAAPSQFAASPHFEQNVGQTANGADFVARGAQYRVGLAADGPRVALPTNGRMAPLGVELIGANADARPSGVERLSATAHYFRKGALVAPLFERVQYSNVYEGISAQYRLTEGRLEYDFLVAPGADPGLVRLRFHGADDVRIADDGGLAIAFGGHILHQPAPVLYQDGPEGRTIVEGGHLIAENGEVSFRVGDYDRERTLVIDPVLDYSTYLGAGDEDAGHGIAVDSDGNVYVAGSTNSSDFPVSSGVFLSTFGGDESDAFVSKFSPEGELLFSMFYGSESSDAATDIAVGQDGSIYITGWTESENLPVSGFQTQYGGFRDCFVAQFSSDGSQLMHSSYLGHGDEDACNAIAVNAQGEVFVAGYTRSMDFPSTAGVLQATQAGERDAFVTKISADGSQIVFSTFLGGVADDTAYDLALNSDGAIVVVGDTSSNGFPVSDDARQNVRRAIDGFVAVLAPDAATLEYGSFIGGQNDDLALGVAVSANDEIYVVGQTDSPDLEVSASPEHSALNGTETDMFVSIFDPSGANLVYGSYYGGSARDFANDVAVDAAGRIYIVGGTASDDFPVSENALLGEARGNADAVLLELERNGSKVLMASYFGGENDDEATAITVNAMGNAYMTGWTRSNNVPITPNAYQSEFHDNNLPVIDGPSEVFVSFLAPEDGERPFTVVSSASFGFTSLAGGSIVSGFGSGLATSQMVATEVPLPTELGGVMVVITDANGVDTNAQLLMISPGQINFVLPDVSSSENLTATVMLDGAAVASGVIPVELVSPSLYTADFSGTGVAAAYAVQLRNGEQTSALVFDANTMAATPIDLTGADTVLELYGTGIRNAASVTATANGQDVEALYSGEAPGFIGLDQVNVRLPESMAGAGMVTIVVTADGIASNPVTVQVQ
ncbi:MAG: SBBP repeat-containing protein [Bryobacterales bacterium]|nr:SBBP repeat-containing protein [Bryobacterales bacterium]